MIPGHLVRAIDWSWAFLASFGVWEEEKVRSRSPPEAGFGSPDQLHKAVCSVQVQDARCPPSACENMEEKRMDVDEDSRVWHADKRYVCTPLPVSVVLQIDHLQGSDRRVPSGRATHLASITWYHSPDCGCMLPQSGHGKCVWSTWLPYLC